MKKLIMLLITVFAIPVVSEVYDPVASKQTHLMYTPTPNTNDQNTLVLGLHELSYSLDDNFPMRAASSSNFIFMNAGF